MAKGTILHFRKIKILPAATWRDRGTADMSQTVLHLQVAAAMFTFFHNIEWTLLPGHSYNECLHHC